MTPGRRDHLLPSFNSPASAKLGRLLESAYDKGGGASLQQEELPREIIDGLATTAVSSTSEEYDPPRVWFQRDEDKRQNDEFTRKVDEMVTELKRLVRERRTEHEHRVAESAEREARMARDMDSLESENSNILEALKQELGSEDALSTVIGKLQIRQRQGSESVAQLEKRKAKLESELRRRQQVIAEKRAVLEEQASKNQPEVEFFERNMGLSMVGGGHGDSLTFVFTLISVTEPLRPFSLTVDLSQREYRVTKCMPNVDGLQAHVDWVNKSRDFFEFLKRARREFVEHYHNESL